MPKSFFKIIDISFVNQNINLQGTSITAIPFKALVATHNGKAVTVNIARYWQKDFPHGPTPIKERKTSLINEKKGSFFVADVIEPVHFMFEKYLDARLNNFAENTTYCP